MLARPESEESLVELVRRAAEERKTVRAVGAGHSSMPLVETDGVLVSLERMKECVACDQETRWAPAANRAAAT